MRTVRSRMKRILYILVLSLTVCLSSSLANGEKDVGGCPRYCSACHEGRCVRCMLGKTGPDCEDDCPLSCPLGCDIQGDCHCRDIARCLTCDGQSCTSCRPGYHGRFCEIFCPLTCRSCHSNGTCAECVEGHYGESCDQRCPLCEHECDRWTGACVYSCHEDPWCRSCHGNTCVRCSGKRFGDRCERNCRETCLECSSQDHCIGCISGFHGPTCNRACNSTCEGGVCHQDTGRCPENPCTVNPDCWRCDNKVCVECMPGRHGQHCHLDCPENCRDRCAQNGTCTPFDCTPGYYGATCQQCSKACLDEDCDVNTGVCQRHICPDNPHCLVCHANTCDQCKHGRWGPNCEFACPAQCEGSCDRQGACCNVTHWGPRCTTECPHNCALGPSGRYCDMHTGRCSRCEPAFWGDRCEYRKCADNDHCIRCQGDLCSGCRTGFWGRHCENTCPSGCDRQKGCTQGGACVGCHDNRSWGVACNYSCPSSCDGACQQFHGGQCLRCRPGSYGNFCEKKCSTHCRGGRCQKEDGHCSADCVAGYRGQTCTEECKRGTFGQNCRENCSTHCAGACDHSDGSCSGCKAGFWGPKCGQACGEGRYGHDCVYSCSAGCSNNCYPSDGHCDCLPGYTGLKCDLDCAYGTFGQDCSGQCSAGCVGGCDHIDGGCRCLHGYAGHRCQIRTDAKPPRHSTSNASPTWAIGLIAGLLGAALFVFLGFVIFITLKRRKQRREDPPQRMQLSQLMSNAVYSIETMAPAAAPAPAPQYTASLPEYTDTKHGPLPSASEA